VAQPTTKPKLFGVVAIPRGCPTWLVAARKLPSAFHLTSVIGAKFLKNMTFEEAIA
jgi:hypothetical protein